MAVVKEDDRPGGGRGVGEEFIKGIIREDSIPLFELIMIPAVNAMSNESEGYKNIVRFQFQQNLLF